MPRKNERPVEGGLLGLAAAVEDAGDEGNEGDKAVGGIERIRRPKGSPPKDEKGESGSSRPSRGKPGKTGQREVQQVVPRPATTQTHIPQPQGGKVDASTSSRDLVHKNDSPEMARVLHLAVLPRPKVDGKENPHYGPALEALKSAVAAVPDDELGRKTNLLAQRVIAGTATQQEINTLFGIWTAQGRRYKAFLVNAVSKAVQAIMRSREAYADLFNATITVIVNGEEKVVPLARQVVGTNHVAYAYRTEALPEYLALLKKYRMTAEAEQLDAFIRESNRRAVLAGMNRQQLPKGEKDEEPTS